jgi:streptogramin lyase
MNCGPVVRFLCALPQSAFAPHAVATRSLSPEPASQPATTAWTSARRIAGGTLLLGLLAVSPLHAQTATVGNTVPLGGGFQLPYGVAVDASGNVYVADEQGSAVKEMPPGCATSTCVTTLGAGFLFPTSVAVDSSGNVYVADYGNSAVKEMTPGCATSTCVTTLGGGFVNPQGVAVDSSGNVYVADYGNNAVKEMTPNCTSSSCVTPLGAGFVSPAEVAVDASDNVYVTDGQNNGAVKEMTPDCTSSSCVTMLGGGFNLPFGVAVDGSGNIYVGDTGNYVMKEMPSGCAASTCVITLFADVVGVAVSASGILYFSDDNAGNNTVDEFFPQSLRLHAVAVRSTGPAVPVSFYFTAGGSGISATVVTQGASGLDFADAGTGTCDTNGTGHTYNTGDTCSVKVTLTPKYPGPRYGAVQLLNGSRSVIATALIYGTGQGPQIQFPSNPTIAPLGGGFRFPPGVAVDSAGNVYVADAVNSAVKEMPAGCATSSCVTTLGGGFLDPSAVAVDGAGNIYVADTSNSKVKEMPPACASSSCVITLGGGFNQPGGVAVDGSGNVYVADSNNGVVKEMPPGCATSSCVTTLGGGFGDPQGVALDASGNIYVGDYGNHALYELPPGCASSSCVTTLGGGFVNPQGVAVDSSGNVYVADYGNSLVKEMPAGCPSASCVTTLGGGFSAPTGVAVDASGNVYVADYGNNAVKELPLAIPPSLSFAAANMGTQSSDSPKTVTLRNIGNQSLVFPVPGTGENPSVSASFTLDPATTCPEVLSSGSAGALASGASCGLAVDFIPRSTGSIPGSAVLTDNNLNVANATQSIGLSGTGLTALITPAVTVSPASSKITTSEALSVTVTGERRNR